MMGYMSDYSKQHHFPKRNAQRGNFLPCTVQTKTKKTKDGLHNVQSNIYVL